MVNMYTFKQFLIEMPFFDKDHKQTTNAYSPQAVAAKLSDNATHIDTISGTKTKYKLYKNILKRHNDSDYCEFLAVHPETNQVHMKVVGDLMHHDNSFHVSHVRSMDRKHRESNIAPHFYHTIIQHHDMVSDLTNSEGSAKIYDKLSRTNVKMKAFQLGNEQNATKVKPGETAKHYSTDPNSKQAITQFRLSKQ